MDGVFGYFSAMDIRQENLKIAVLIFNYGAKIIGNGLIVKDLEINVVAFGIEARHDYVVGSNSMAVVA